VRYFASVRRTRLWASKGSTRAIAERHFARNVSTSSGWNLLAHSHPRTSSKGRPKYFSHPRLAKSMYPSALALCNGTGAPSANARKGSLSIGSALSLKNETTASGRVTLCGSAVPANFFRIERSQSHEVLTCDMNICSPTWRWHAAHCLNNRRRYFTDHALRPLLKGPS
jgi:hypothetical protein